VAVAADPAALAVVGHQDDGRAVQPAALLEERQELAHVPVGLGQLVQVLTASHAAHVPELVGGQQLEHEQVGVLLGDHAAPLGGQRAVDLGRRLHGGHRANNVLAERIEQVRDPHEPAAATLALEDVEDGLAADAEPWREVRAHPVLGRRGAGEHRREADHRPRWIGRLDGEVLGSLAREPVHDRSVGLPQPAAVAAVDDDHVHAPREPCRAGAGRDRGRREPLGASVRVARQSSRERARGHRTQRGRYRHGGRRPRRRAGARLLRHERCRTQGDQQLRDLLERVPARGVRVREHQAPEAQAVGPGRSGAQVVVDGAPHDHREERVSRERAGEQPRRSPRLEQRDRRQRREPEQHAPPQREWEARQHEGGGHGREHGETEPAVRREPHRRGREQHDGRVDDRERAPLVEDVPCARRPYLDGARGSVVPGGHARHSIRAP
jgi:hypothetical protein